VTPEHQQEIAPYESNPTIPLARPITESAVPKITFGTCDAAIICI